MSKEEMYREMDNLRYKILTMPNQEEKSKCECPQHNHRTNMCCSYCKHQEQQNKEIKREHGKTTGKECRLWRIKQNKEEKCKWCHLVHDPMFACKPYVDSLINTPPPPQNTRGEELKKEFVSITDWPDKGAIADYWLSKFSVYKESILAEVGKMETYEMDWGDGTLDVIPKSTVLSIISNSK